MIDQAHAQLMRTIWLALPDDVSIAHAAVALEDVYAGLNSALVSRVTSMARTKALALEAMQDAGAKFDAETTA